MSASLRHKGSGPSLSKRTEVYCQIEYIILRVQQTQTQIQQIWVKYATTFPNKYKKTKPVFLQKVGDQWVQSTARLEYYQQKDMLWTMSCITVFVKSNQVHS